MRDQAKREREREREKWATINRNETSIRQSRRPFPSKGIYSYRMCPAALWATHLSKRKTGFLQWLGRLLGFKWHFVIAKRPRYLFWQAKCRLNIPQFKRIAFSMDNFNPLLASLSLRWPHSFHLQSTLIYYFNLWAFHSFQLEIVTTFLLRSNGFAVTVALLCHLKYL